MLDWAIQLFDNYQDYFIWAGIISAVVFVLSLALTPYLLGLIPQKYFLGHAQKSSGGFLLRALKNIAGALLVLAGLIMLVTPGQGIVSILLGLFLMQFPGKRKLEIKLIHHDPTFKTLNWLRSKVSKPPFIR